MPPTAPPAGSDTRDEWIAAAYVGRADAGGAWSAATAELANWIVVESHFGAVWDWSAATHSFASV